MVWTAEREVSDGHEIDVSGPGRRSARAATLPLVVLVKWLLIIPHVIVLVVL